NMRRVIEKVEEEAGEISSFKATGGGAQNDAFIKTRATITETSIQIPKELEASSFGIFALASVKTGWYNSVSEAISYLNPVRKTIKKNISNKRKYKNLYKNYKKLVDLTNSWYNSTNVYY